MDRKYKKDSTFSEEKDQSQSSIDLIRSFNFETGTWASMPDFNYNPEIKKDKRLLNAMESINRIEKHCNSISSYNLSRTSLNEKVQKSSKPP